MKIQNTKHPEAGFMGIEALGALLVFLLLLPAVNALWNLGITEVKKRAVADHLSRVVTAAQVYSRVNYDSLLTTTTASAGPAITVEDLRDANLVPQGFGDHNAWGQSYAITFRQPVAGELQSLVLTTGGRGHSASDPAFANAVVPSTAALAGGFAGYIPTGTVPGQSTGTLRGSFGGFVMDLSALGINNPGPGHLGAIINLTAQDMAQDFLYRVKVPGHPELNAMTTELDMTDHAITGVKELQFEQHDLTDRAGFCATPADEGRVFLDRATGLYLCRNGQVEAVADSGNSTLFSQSLLAVDGGTIKKPVCPQGTNTHPEIFVAPSIMAAGAKSPPMVAMQAWASSLNDEEWQVHLRLLTSNTTLDWIHPGPDYGRIMVFTTCAKD